LAIRKRSNQNSDRKKYVTKDKGTSNGVGCRRIKALVAKKKPPETSIQSLTSERKT